MPIVKKIHRLKRAQYALLDHSKTPAFSDVITIDILFKYSRACAIRTYSSRGKKKLYRATLNELKDLEALVKEHNPSFAIGLYSCFTVQVENLHAVGHFKDQFPTLLQYARNLANTVYQSIKRVVPWSAYYFTHNKSYYPVLRQSTPVNAIPKLEHLNPRRELNRQKKDLMIEWATNNGKAARQRSVGQETTMFKAGTLPLNMYQAFDYPKDKVSFSLDTID